MECLFPGRAGMWRYWFGWLLPSSVMKPGEVMNELDEN